jgi:hypothetical protein
VPEDSTDAQCPACTAGDRGRQIARDAALGDDGRAYALYLAWFGPGSNVPARSRGTSMPISLLASVRIVLGRVPLRTLPLPWPTGSCFS